MSWCFVVTVQYTARQRVPTGYNDLRITSVSPPREVRYAMDLPPDEMLLAEAAHYLVRQGQREAARLVLACSIHVFEIDPDRNPDPNTDDEHRFDKCVTAVFRGPDEVTRILLDRSENSPRWIVWDAVEQVLPLGYQLRYMNAFPGINWFDPMWRSQLLEMAQREKVDNQGEGFAENIIVWNGLRYRSESERRIAAALDREGVLFLPNCRARLGPEGKRLNREGDFLVCHEGKWGLLEVDGEPFHPPTRKAQEDERDRLFKQHGVCVVEHFDAVRCYETPIEVVKQFLAILKQS